MTRTSIRRQKARGRKASSIGVVSISIQLLRGRRDGGSKMEKMVERSDAAFGPRMGGQNREERLLVPIRTAKRWPGPPHQRIDNHRGPKKTAKRALPNPTKEWEMRKVKEGRRCYRRQNARKWWLTGQENRGVPRESGKRQRRQAMRRKREEKCVQ